MAEGGKPGGSGKVEDTASITETDYDLEEVPSLTRSAEELLGGRSLGSSPKPKALLRLQNGMVSETLARRFGIGAQTAGRGLNGEPIPVVLGPYFLSEIEELASLRHLRGKDCVLLPMDRWKTLREVFPKVLPDDAPDDVTDTYTESLIGQTGSQDPEDLLKLEAEQKSLELESAGNIGGEAENKESSPKPRPLTTPRAQAVRGSGVTRPFYSSGAVPAASRWGLWIVLGAAGVGAGAYFWLQKRARDARVIAESLPAPPAPVPGAMGSSSRGAAHASDWPENLQPRHLEDLYAEDPPLVRKIRPLLIAYENGSTALSSADERTLLEAASPGSASFDARRLAANQLAVLYLANSRIDQAKRTLAPMMESADSDPVTLINASLLELGNGEYGQAWDYATTALRVASPAEAWIAHSVVGLVSGYRGMAEQAEAGFRDALRASPANPFVYGLFLRFLSDRPGNREKVARVLEEALWSDPDRLLDSPIRAPVAGHVLTAFAFEGLLKAAESSEVKLSEGKKAFVRWLEARYRRNPVSQPLSAVIQSLSTELDPQSQVLHAYLLQEQGRLDEAAESLSRVIPSLGTGPSNNLGSWPWSLAADVQYSRGNLSQALLLYHNALNRNPQDVDAVLGLALLSREKGDYTQSLQKFSEARALDPLFIPAFLRMSRFDWHRGYRAQ